MKKLLLVLIISVITLCASCSSGNQGISHTNLNEFIGDWHIYGTFYLDLDGRIFEQPIDRVSTSDLEYFRTLWDISTPQLILKEIFI